LAKLALREGFGPEEVARAAYSGHHFGRGTGKEYWRRWDEAFASLDCTADMESGWQEVIHHGRAYALEHIRQAERRRRRIERDGIVVGPG
jgi:hypothetical protein